MGGFHDDDTTTILLGPKEPGFWDYVTDRPEFSGEDPLDLWSQWAITALAHITASTPLFPFGGPPFQPFISWALKSGEAWQSPVGLIVHKDTGLLASYRGALRFEGLIDLPPPATRPCDSCASKPCLTVCPVAAIGEAGYDVPKCKAHVRGDPVCQAGCRVRLSCPISTSYGRTADQTAFHMKAFMGE
jgi:hypothetical protein